MSIKIAQSILPWAILIYKLTIKAACRCKPRYRRQRKGYDR